MTRDDDDKRDDDKRDDDGRRRQKEAPKERVLHTRVPAVLEQELKRLARSLRVPVSNVVRAILEDAIDAVDSVGERAEDELQSFVERLARQRDELRSRIAKREAEDEVADAEVVEEEREPSRLPCPEAAPEILEGVFGYQSLVLATDARCSVCDRPLAAGTEAHRALFDEPGKRVFLGPECRLLPEKRS